MPLPALASFALPAAARLATSAIKSVGSALGGAAAAAGADVLKAEELKAKAKDKANDFERLFLEQTLDRLFASDESEGPLGANGTGGDVYRSMLVKEYAKAVNVSGGIGIADQVYSQLLRLQEGGAGGTRV